MRGIFNYFALIIGLSVVLLGSQAASAQFQYNYSSNMWVNSGMNQLFQNRWTIARMRAAGKNDLADAMEGRRTNGNQANVQTAPTENILRRVPLSETGFRSTRTPVMPLVLGAKLVDAKQEEVQTLVKASSELLKNYEQLLVENKETRLKNNVAGAAVFALAMSRAVLTDGKELTEKQQEAILQDINSLLASSDQFKKLPDIEKQKMYETFIISSGLAMMMYQQGKESGSAEPLNNGRELAKNVLAQFFDRPVEEIKFTDNGVEF